MESYTTCLLYDVCQPLLLAGKETDNSLRQACKDIVAIKLTGSVLLRRIEEFITKSYSDISSCSQDDLTYGATLIKVVECLLQMPNANKAILAKGFHYEKINDVPCLKAHCCSYAVYAFKNKPEFFQLFNCIGYLNFFRLVTSYMLFMPTNNKTNYIQISGYSIGQAELSVLISNFDLLVSSPSTDIAISSGIRDSSNSIAKRLSEVKLSVVTCSCVYYSHQELENQKKNLMFYKSKPVDDSIKSLPSAIFYDTEKPSKCWKKRVFKTAKSLKISQLLKRNNYCNYRNLLKKTTSQDVDVLSKMTDKHHLKDLLSNNTPINEVRKFIVSALTRVIPECAWGTNKNKNLILKALLPVVGDKKERHSIHTLTKGLKISEFKWLRSSSNVHPSPLQNICEELMFCLWIKWLLIGFIFPLLSTHFYITEKNKSLGNVVIFYKKKIWCNIKKIGIHNMLEDDMIAQVGPFDFQRKPLGISSLRFIPKTESLRPIANLSSTVSIGSWRVPVNNQLFRVLRI
jgi:telomerase reverse transcriptase